MASRRGCTLLVFSFVIFQFAIAPPARVQGAKPTVSENPISDVDKDRVKERAAWFYRGRIVHGQPSAELRRRAYQAKLAMRTQNARALAVKANSQPSLSSGSWTPLGPAPSRFSRETAIRRSLWYWLLPGRPIIPAIRILDWAFYGPRMGAQVGA